MNILIVGSAGYLGGAVTELAIKEKHNIRAYDISAYADTCPAYIECVQGDVRDYNALKSHLNWADAVIWSAAVVGAGAGEEDARYTKEVNQDSVKWLSENYDGRIVFTSTCSVYGRQEKEVTENTPVNPLSSYAVTKLAAENYLKDKNAIVFRLGTLYGIGDSIERVRFNLILNYLVKEAVEKGEITISTKKQYRPLLHVKDAAQVILSSAKSKYRGIYNLHSENMLVSDLAGAVKKHFPDVLINTTDENFEDARNYAVNSDKARQSLGLKARYSVSDGIEELKRILINDRTKLQC